MTQCADKLNWWNAYQKYVSDVVLFNTGTDQKNISFWRNRIFLRILSYLTPLSLFALIPGVYMSFAKGLPVVGFVDLLSFIMLAIILLKRNIPLEIRKSVFIFVFYALSIVLIYYLGKTGPGLLFLLTSTVISSIIHSGKAGYYSAWANTFICIIFGVLNAFNLQIPLSIDYPLGVWIAVTSNLVILSFTCAKCLDLLLEGLDSSLISNKKVEERFRGLVENSADAVAIISQTGNLIYISPSIERILGYSESEIMKMDIFSLLHPDDLENTGKLWTHVLRTKAIAVSGHTGRMRHKNGTWRWIEATVTNMLHDPSINGIVDNFRDVTDKVEAEKQRIFEENNLNALINNTSDLMWSVDRDFNLITSNIPFNEMAKINFGKVIKKGDNVFSVNFPDEILQAFKPLYERAFAGEIFIQIDHLYIPSESWVEISYYPIKKNNEIIGCACHSRDITFAKIAERQLQKSEAFSNGILNSLSSHIAVLDASGTIVAVNESWKRFALENGETTFLNTCEGANYYEVCERAASEGFTEAIEALNGIKEVMNGEKTSFYLEYPCHSNHEKKWFGMRVLKFDSDESLVVIAHQNISERKLAEENLQKSETSLNEAQAIAHLGNWELDFKTNQHSWSNELYNIFGINKEDVTPSTELFLSFMHPDDYNQIKIQVDEAFKNLKATSYNFRFVKKDGTVRYGYTERRFEFDKNNKPMRLLGVVQDITERKLIEDEREKMTLNIIQHTKNLEQFASIVSHNLRAPVANILGLANILQNNISETDKVKSLQFLFKATEQLDVVLKDLNKILQVKAEINEYKEEINFNNLVKSIKSSIHTQIEEETVDIITDFSEVERIVSVKSYIHSIFYNLISNSIKYRQKDKGSVIRIKSNLSNGKIKLSFKDNGTGIDLVKHGSKIFGLYNRFHSNIEGKGIGLFMVKTQVESLGGNIDIKSKPGEGTEFIIELPLSDTKKT